VDLVSLPFFGINSLCATGQSLQKTPVQRQVEGHYPEQASGLHLPKMARVVAPTEAVKSGNFADPFRPTMPSICNCWTLTAIRTAARRFILPCRCLFRCPEQFST